mmetsp:Transcript_6090/g.9036  ORF Transcript_6090/g.9036 Transcript_6090/m.9036 type:complete len:609 (-) Transcript_6090:184-2010(-)
MNNIRVVVLAFLSRISVANIQKGPIVEWSHVTVETKSGKVLISDVCGYALPGRLIALMGPSGAGKSTIMNAIAGRIPASNLKVQGEVRIDGEIKEYGASGAAFVKQENEFYPYSTVRETLEFAARLRLPRDITFEEKAKVVDSVLKKTGLKKAQDTLIGGCSGGERKRLAIACELIDDPSLLFCDEPTSGLDSFAAERVVKTLRNLANEGKTIICVIHQPSSTCFELFDDLLLISEGTTCYFGPIVDADRFFASVGAKRPSTAAKAEHYVEVVSVDYETEEAAIRTRALVDKISNRLKARPLPVQPSLSSSFQKDQKIAHSKKKSATIFEQYKLLYTRALKDVLRAKGPNAIKAAQQLMSALIYGGIYSLDDSQASIQDRFGLLSLCTIGATNLAVASTIRAFPKEKSIVTEERSKGMYGAFSYLVSKIAAETPLISVLSTLFGCVIYPLTGLQRNLSKFLVFIGVNVLNSLTASALGLLVGAVAPSSDTALALFPVIIILNVVFNGMNIQNVPKVLRWLPNLSLVRWGFEGLAVNEFKGLSFKPRNRPGPPNFLTGDDALDRFNLGQATVKKTVVAQSLILGGCYFSTYRALRNSRTNYAKISAAPL